MFSCASSVTWTACDSLWFGVRQYQSRYFFPLNIVKHLGSKSSWCYLLLSRCLTRSKLGASQLPNCPYFLEWCTAWASSPQQCSMAINHSLTWTAKLWLTPLSTHHKTMLISWSNHGAPTKRSVACLTYSKFGSGAASTTIEHYSLLVKATQCLFRCVTPNTKKVLIMSEVTKFQKVLIIIVQHEKTGIAEPVFSVINWIYRCR